MTSNPQIISVPPPTTTTLTPSAPSCDEPGLYVAMDPVAASPQPLIGCSFLCGGTPACTVGLIDVVFSITNFVSFWLPSFLALFRLR